MIWALIGTGPSLKDVHDWPALRAERKILLVNGSVEILHDTLDPPAEVVLLHDPIAARKWFKFLQPGQLLATTVSITEWGGGLSHAESVEISGWEPKHVTVPPKGWGGSLPRALLHIHEHEGDSEIELYGYDLTERYYHNQIKPSADYTLANALTVTNCCPSTESDLFPVESRPWTLACGSGKIE